MKTIKILTRVVAILTTVLTVLILLGSIIDGESVIETIAIPTIISALFFFFSFLAKKGRKDALLLSLIGYLGLTLLTGALKLIPSDTATLHIVAALILILITLFSSNHEARS